MLIRAENVLSNYGAWYSTFIETFSVLCTLNVKIRHTTIVILKISYFCMASLLALYKTICSYVQNHLLLHSPRYGIELANKAKAIIIETA